MDSRPLNDDADDLKGHGEHLRRLARGLLYGRSGAEDVVQQAWLAALQQGPRAGWSLRAWLTGAVRNQARQTLREETRRTRRERIAARPETLPSAADSAERLELLQRVVAAVQALEEPYRSVVLARFIDDLPPREIARRRGVPVETVRTQARRGLERLRRELAPEQPEQLGAFLGLLATFAGPPPLGVPLPLSHLTEGITGVLMGMQTKAVVGAALVVAVGSLAAWRWAAGPAAEPSRAPEAPRPTASEPAQTVQPPTAPAGLAQAPAAGAASPDDTRRSVGSVEPEIAWGVRGMTLAPGDAGLPGVALEASLYAGFEAAGEPLERVELLSDEQGAFTWPLEAPSSTVTLSFVARREGYLRRNLELQVLRGTQPETVEVNLRPLDVVVVGSVRDLAGRPIVGAHIEWTSEQTAVSDAEGAFRLRANSSYTTLYLSAWAAGYTEEREIVTCTGAGEVQGAVFVLRPSRTVSGRVLDERGAAVSGASVRDWSRTSFATSDGLGRYHLDHRDPSAEFTLYASKPGWVSARSNLSAGSSAVELDLFLRRGAEVEGRVLDETGQPVAGAQVFVGDSPWSVDAVTAHSDDEGRFLLSAVGPGRGILGASAEGFAQHEGEIEVPAAGGRLAGQVVTLSRGHFTGGRVVDEQGQPLAGVYISARLGWDYLDLRERTDEQGRFRVQGLPEGDLKLELYGNGLERLQHALEQLDRDDLELVMRRAGRLAGRVLDDATGEPIQDFRIRLVNPRLAAGEQAASGIEISWVEDGRAFHDEQGRWGMPGEELELGGIYAVEARAAGYAPAVNLHVVAEAEPDPDEHVLRLVPGAELRGQVVAAESGAPIAGALVTRMPASQVGEPMRFSDTNPAFQVLTEDDGWFALANVPAGELSLRVEHPDWMDLESEPMQVPAGGSPAPLRFELEAGARLTGRLLDADGGILARQRVELERQRSDPGARPAAQTVLSDGDGRFAFEHLAEGLYHLRHTRQDGDLTALMLSLGVQVADRGTQDVELRPRGSAQIQGRLVTTGEVPARAQITVMLDIPGNDPRSELLRLGSQRRVLTDSGDFSFEGLEAGKYRLWMHAYDRLSGTNWNGQTRITVVDGESAFATLPIQAR